MFNQAVLHLDLDAFFASVEILNDSRLTGYPLIITGDRGGGGIVLSCSYEARRFGVKRSMPVTLASRLCPQAVFRKGDLDHYNYHSDVITEIIAEQAPVFERAALDNFYLDLSGMDRYLGVWQWSRELKQTILKESGLPLSLGLSINKLVSRVATSEDRPSSELVIDPGSERHFLAPLSVRRLPAVGRKTTKKLAFMGVKRVQTLAGIPPRLLENEFGKTGRKLWLKANGVDHSRVIPYVASKELRREHVFHRETADVNELRRQLTRMVVELGFELRTTGRLAGQIAIKVRYVDEDTYVRRQQIDHTASESSLLNTASRVFDKVFTRRQLVRTIGAKVTRLVPGHTQADLFATDEREARLLLAMDRIRDRYGISKLT